MKVRGGTNLDFKNMKLHTGYPTHNTDGLLLAGVHGACVDNIDVLNGDDCLKVMDSTSDVTFSNFRIQGGHGMTVGGGGDSLSIDNVRWVNGTAIDTVHGAQIKWTHGTGGHIKNIVYENINMINVAAPIHIDGNYHGGDEKAKMEIGDLHFMDITATYDGQNRNPGGGDWPSADGKCSPESPLKFHSIGFGCTSKRPCNHVHLHNVHIQGASHWGCDHCSGDTDGNVSPSAPSSLKGSSDSRRRAARCAAPGPPPGPSPGPSPSPSPTPWTPTWQPGQISPLADSGFCLDLVGGDTTNGNLIWLWECNGQENQAWAFPTDSWHIVYQSDQSKCIDAGGGRGGQLQIWDCNGLPQQTWGYDGDMATVYLGDGSQDASCMDLQGGDIRNGSPIWLWECNGQWQQQWNVPSDAVNFVLYNTDICLDLPDEDTTNGNLLWAWECNGHDSQKWLFTEGTWMIRYAGDTSKCVDGAFMGEGSQLQIWDCNDLSQQKWGYDFVEGHVYLSDSATDASLCMDLEDNNVNNGVPVKVYGCSDFPQQNWVVESAEWYSRPANGAKLAKGAKGTKHEQSLMVI